MGEISNKIGVQHLLSRFIDYGIRHIVFSPGSRNAPLVVSFANDEQFKTFVIRDERSAAFYALGMAEQLNEPVAVMCTSGSALLNYAPAVSEAFYRSIPLLVVSADRPKEWTDQGDGQTIRQENVLQNHVLHYASLLETPKTKNEEWSNLRKMDEALTRLIFSKGPVHLNFPFTEPLYETVNEKETPQFSPIRFMQPEEKLDRQQEKDLETIWNSSKKRMILCGQMPKSQYINEQLKQLASDKSVVVLVENTSNLQDRSFVHCIDRTITSFLEKEEDLYAPDLLITLGGAIISKKIKKYFRNHPPKNTWRIGKHFPFMDTYQSLTRSINIAPTSFLELLLKDDFKRNVSRFGEQWKQLDYLVQFQHEDFISRAAYSDLSVISFLLNAVPDQSALHIGNSSTIRYTQLFDPYLRVSYYCNRGTSGIDGSMSTAIGHSIVGKQVVHTLIIGDISFFYDSNALWNNYIPTNFRIFLINNGGGDIFNIIPGPDKTPNQETYFVTHQEQTAKGICEAFNINYYAANSLEEIDKDLDVFYDRQENDRPALMEINTSSAKNSKILKSYFEAIKVKNAPVLEM